MFVQIGKVRRVQQARAADREAHRIGARGRREEALAGRARGRQQAGRVRPQEVAHGR
jgi:hypothetical protein